MVVLCNCLKSRILFSTSRTRKNLGKKGRVHIIKGNENPRKHLQVLIKIEPGTIIATVSRLGYFIVTLSIVTTSPSSNDASVSPLHCLCAESVRLQTDVLNKIPCIRSWCSKTPSWRKWAVVGWGGERSRQFCVKGGQGTALMTESADIISAKEMKRWLAKQAEGRRDRGDISVKFRHSAHRVDVLVLGKNALAWWLLLNQATLLSPGKSWAKTKKVKRPGSWIPSQSN